MIISLFIIVSIILIIVYDMGALGRVLGMFPSGLLIFFVSFTTIRKYTEGKWSFLVENKKKKSYTLNVNSICKSIGIGQIATKAITRTLNDTPIDKITTDSEPVKDFYKISIHNAFKNSQPTLILFSSPAFCTSPVCGPQIESMKLIHEKRFDSEILFASKSF